MDDTIPAERELGLSIGRELVLMCDELWAFGLDCPTAGMAAEIELARERGIPVHNGYERITGTGGETADDGQKDEKPEIGSVTLHLPAFKAMAVCNQHLDHGPITVKLDGGIILDLADRLRMDPGTDIEIGGEKLQGPVPRLLHQAGPAGLQGHPQGRPGRRVRG